MLDNSPLFVYKYIVVIVLQGVVVVVEWKRKIMDPKTTPST